MRKVIHEYWSRKLNRSAVVIDTSKGFEVELYENGAIAEIRRLHEHSESYAESCAENFCDGMFNAVPNPNDVGYYGYNEKTDNFYPELDD